jgi:hypothetical protein
VASDKWRAINSEEKLGKNIYTEGAENEESESFAEVLQAEVAEDYF